MLHTTGLLFAIYCFVLDLLVQLHQSRMLRKQEQQIRRALVEQVEREMPANIAVDFRQFGPLSAVNILKMHDRLSQEAENMRDYLNMVGMLVNQRAVFPARLREHRGVFHRP